MFTVIKNKTKPFFDVKFSAIELFCRIFLSGELTCDALQIEKVELHAK